MGNFSIKDFLSSSKIFFYCTIWLATLLVIGTIAQNRVGIYQSQQIYFSSWLVSKGFILVPGARLVMVVMFINLSCKLLFASPFRVKQLGVIISHYGVFFLLLGGFVTAYYSVEGAMVIPENETVSYFEDYHEVELVVSDSSASDKPELLVVPGEELTKGKVISNASLNGRITVVDFFKNAKVEERKEKSDASARGLLNDFDIQALSLDVNSEKNRAAVILALDGLSPEIDGTYVAFEFMPGEQTIQMGDRLVELSLRHKRYPLPFSIKLIDFSQELHPGTDKAKSYRSIVEVVDRDTTRRAEIVMNHPLRQENYTFYQSSFMQGGGEGDVTVLAVVKNYGRLFPYISSIVICIGLFVHLLIQLPKLIVRQEA
ncbi:MAG: cytochrome c biogenesis protein ResB [Deltaproteobacteria bacterium]|nr:cytochrome c biogenesis protein ResB [Deltaproteobacteria bacterium]